MFYGFRRNETQNQTVSINVGVLTQGLPESQTNRAYCNQMIRSSSSVGANYRASRRAKSNADFINKLKIVEEAGGKVTDMNGDKFSPYQKKIVATNGLIHDELIEVIHNRKQL